MFNKFHFKAKENVNKTLYLRLINKINIYFSKIVSNAIKNTIIKSRKTKEINIINFQLTQYKLNVLNNAIIFIK